MHTNCSEGCVSGLPRVAAKIRGQQIQFKGIMEASQVTLVVKEPARQCRRHKRQGFDPCVEKIPWRRAQQPTPILLPGESHGQRSLAGCSSWGHKEWGTSERLSTQHVDMQI